MGEGECGKRFSLVYGDKGEPVRDSSKARFRLAKLTDSVCKSANGRSDHNKSAQDLIESELGIEFATRSTTGQSLYRWDWYFLKITITELLDSITIVARALQMSYRMDSRFNNYLVGVRRIFTEENLAYTLDAHGGIHPLIDMAFSLSMSSAIASLGGERYAASAECVNRIETCLLQDPRDWVSAIRAVFGACENTFKLMYSVPRLDAAQATAKLGPSQQRLYEGKSGDLGSSAKSLEAFRNWINAAHFYRHEQGVEAPTQPPEELAILLISQGLSFVRWLVALDKQ